MAVDLTWRHESNNGDPKRSDCHQVVNKRVLMQRFATNLAREGLQIPAVRMTDAPLTKAQGA
jgi:hypothetical protein